jgi:4-amino-4-deoxy-L-arabinose transferase-like glycosyltransferase
MDRRVEQRGARPWMLALALVFAVGLGLRVGAAWNPYQPQLPDARAYARLAESLYLDGTDEQRGDFVPRDLQDPENYSPGLPLFVAGIYHLAGGVDLRLARLVLAMIGALAIPLAFLIGRHLAGPAAGLVAAVPVAVYPALLDYQGMLMTEPMATTLLAAGVLGFIWAADGRGAGAWAVPGLLFGLLAMVRPEYLPFGFLLALLALLLVRRRSGPRAGVAVAAVMLAAFALPVIPWTIRNALVLDRFVPISTGGGKALYVGTYLPADGDYQRVKATLLERFRGRRLEPNSEALDQVDPEPLFDRVAARYPDLPRDEALGKIGRQQLSDDLGDHPLDYAAMTVRKVWRMWSSGVGEAMASTPGRVVQMIVVLLGLAGLGVLLVRRRFLEAIVFAVPIAAVTAIGAVTLASNRRSEVLMTLVFPLAAAAITRGVAFSRQRLGEGRAPAGPSHSRAQA